MLVQLGVGSSVLMFAEASSTIVESACSVDVWLDGLLVESNTSSRESVSVVKVPSE